MINTSRIHVHNNWLIYLHFGVSFYIQISLDFPSEYITEVSGYTGKVRGYTVVRSLTFKTNKKTYGPYGVTSGTPFNLPIENGLIVGFKGSIGYWLDYIGFYLSL